MTLPARKVSTAAAARPASEPFRDAEAAWLWAVAALKARHDGASFRGTQRVSRPCDPDDVLKTLDRLYRAGRLLPAHARVLGFWGQRGIAPDATLQADRLDRALWREALAMLEAPLRGRGIVS